METRMFVRNDAKPTSVLAAKVKLCVMEANHLKSYFCIVLVIIPLHLATVSQQHSYMFKKKNMDLKVFKAGSGNHGAHSSAIAA